MEIKKGSRIDKWRKQYVWFNALMFILVGDNDIIFKTPEQIARSAKKAKKPNMILTSFKKGANKGKEPAKNSLKIDRYY